MIDFEVAFTNIIDYFNRCVIEDKLSHAYLIETNIEDKIQLAKVLIGKILNKENDISKKELIEKELFPDIFIVRAEGLWIKKEQIIDLQKEFKAKSILNNKRIYIIEEAEKLNKSSANTLLKFLEEPENDIIAMLFTSNKHLVLDTITSRCQRLKAITCNNYFEKLTEEDKDDLNKVIHCIEENKEKAIAHIPMLEIKKFADKEYVTKLFKNMLYFYDDVLLRKTNERASAKIKSLDIFNQVVEKNDIKSIIRKIKALNTCINRLKYNVNVKLILDKLIILMNGDEENV